MAVLLVRHAAAGDRRQWDGDDRHRPLTDVGYRQAIALGSLLSPFEPARVISSPAARCVETVAPLAEALNLEVERAEALFEGETRKALDLVRGYRDENVALCSHGDVIPYVIEALEREESLTITTEVRWKKASTWVLDHGDHGWSARYLPPPAAQ